MFNVGFNPIDESVNFGVNSRVTRNCTFVSVTDDPTQFSITPGINFRFYETVSEIES